MDKSFFYNDARVVLGIDGWVDMHGNYGGGITPAQFNQIDQKAEEIFLEKKKEVDAMLSVNELKRKALEFVIRGEQVPQKLSEKIKLGEEMAECVFDFTSADPLEDKMYKYDIENYGANVDQNGAYFDGNAYMRISPKIPLKNSSFKIEASVSVSNVKNKNYFFGDSGSTRNKALHIGWRDEDTFTVDFWADGMDVNFPQEAGEDVVFVFEFNADTLEGKLTLNGIEFSHTFDGKLQDNAFLIGKAANGKFEGAMKNLKVTIL